MKSESKTKMSTPIKYYGGKTKMVRHILPLIPEHEIYIEPFFGGGAVYFAKERVKCEVINDVNMNVVNFYQVLKHDYFALAKRLQKTLHSRDLYKKAKIIYDCPELFDDDPVIRAWAFYVLTNQGFAAKVGTWGYSRSNTATTVQNKIDAFNEVLSERIKHTQIENNDAHKVIQSRDAENAFVYADPPYINTNQGHYGGYTEEHFRRDLDALANMKGKFLLSTYPSEVLAEYTKKYGWQTISVDQVLGAGNGAVLKKRKIKTEVLTANYKII